MNTVRIVTSEKIKLSVALCCCSDTQQAVMGFILGHIFDHIWPISTRNSVIDVVAQRKAF